MEEAKGRRAPAAKTGALPCAKELCLFAGVRRNRSDCFVRRRTSVDGSASCSVPWCKPANCLSMGRAKANSPFALNGPKYPLSQIRSRNIPCVFQTRDREDLRIVSFRFGMERALRSGDSQWRDYWRDCGENMARTYIHELIDWPTFTWDSKTLAPPCSLG